MNPASVKDYNPMVSLCGQCSGRGEAHYCNEINLYCVNEGESPHDTNYDNSSHVDKTIGERKCEPFSKGDASETFVQEGEELINRQTGDKMALPDLASRIGQ